MFDWIVVVLIEVVPLVVLVSTGINELGLKKFQNIAMITTKVKAAIINAII